MSVPDAAAERLHALYVDELVHSLMPPVHPMVDTRQSQALIRHARASGPGQCEAPDETTWIWSDLHLGHRVSLGVFFRPFGTVRRADQAMMDAWYDLVGADDTIIGLGDVSVDGSVQAYHQCWWRAAPGIKWLVLGNHDVDPVNHVRPLEVEGTAVTLVAPGDPPLLLTHVPLLQVPPGWVNIYGHVHQQESPSRNRHINVSVHREDARHHYEMSQRAVRAAGGAARRAPFSKILLDNFLTAGCRRSGMTATAALRRPQRPAAARIRGK